MRAVRRDASAAALVAALLCAASIAGCGSSGGGTVSVSGSAPAGYTPYSGAGFAFSVPGGLAQATGSPLADGTVHTVWAGSGANVNLGYSAHSSESVEAAVTNEQTLEQQANSLPAGTVYHVHSRQVLTAHVAGASGAELIKEQATSQYGAKSSQELIVRTPQGALIDLTVADTSAHGGIDPGAVVDSFRLTG